MMNFWANYLDEFACVSGRSLHLRVTVSLAASPDIFQPAMASEESNHIQRSDALAPTLQLVGFHGSPDKPGYRFAYRVYARHGIFQSSKETTHRSPSPTGEHQQSNKFVRSRIMPKTIRL